MFLKYQIQKSFSDDTVISRQLVLHISTVISAVIWKEKEFRNTKNTRIFSKMLKYLKVQLVKILRVRSSIHE